MRRSRPHALPHHRRGIAVARGGARLCPRGRHRHDRSARHRRPQRAGRCRAPSWSRPRGACGLPALSVSCICTPLLKWSPPEQGGAGQGRPVRLRSRRPHAGRGLRADLRVCATSRRAQPAHAFKLSDLRRIPRGRFARANRRNCWRWRTKFDMKLHVENEGVCNIAGFAELEALVTAYRHPRLRALPDISNAFGQASPPICRRSGATAACSRTSWHFKDYDNASPPLRRRRRGRSCRIASLLAQTLPAHDAPLTLTIETHARTPSRRSSPRRSMRCTVAPLVDSLPQARSQHACQAEAIRDAACPGGAPMRTFRRANRPRRPTAPGVSRRSRVCPGAVRPLRCAVTGCYPGDSRTCA